MDLTELVDFCGVESTLFLRVRSFNAVMSFSKFQLMSHQKIFQSSSLKGENEGSCI